MELLVGQGQDPSVHIRQRERWVGGRGFRWLDRDVIARHILPNNLGSTKPDTPVDRTSLLRKANW